MKQTVTEQNLDAVLAQMAEEVPPMPADFHARWMSAVRAESERAEDRQQGRAGPIVRWTRILSVAAAFVFLIGGTLLYRNSRKTLNTVYQAEERATEFAVKEEAAAVEAVAAEEPEEDKAVMKAAESEEAVGAPMVMFQAQNAFSAEDAGMKAAGNAYMGDSAAMPAATDAAEYAEEAAEYEDAAEYTETETAPEETETAAEEMAEETEKTGETEEQEGFLQAAGSFFTDMGDFLLAALPYLAVLAVPAAAALIVRKRRKN